METKEITFNINTKTLTKLQEALKITKTSKDEFITKSIDERIQETMEDLEDYVDAVKEWRKFIDSGEEGIPLEDVMKKYGVIG